MIIETIDVQHEVISYLVNGTPLFCVGWIFAALSIVTSAMAGITDANADAAASSARERSAIREQSRRRRKALVDIGAVGRQAGEAKSTISAVSGASGVEGGSIGVLALDVDVIAKQDIDAIRRGLTESAAETGAEVASEKSRRRGLGTRSLLTVGAGAFQAGAILQDAA